MIATGWHQWSRMQIAVVWTPQIAPTPNFAQTEPRADEPERNLLACNGI